MSYLFIGFDLCSLLVCSLPAATGKEKNTWDFYPHSPTYMIFLDQFAVDRPNLIWTQQVNFIGNKAVNTVGGSSSLWDLPLMK